MNVVGLDLSLTATGVAHPDGTLTTLTTGLRGMERLHWLAEQRIRPLADGADLVCLEGYSMGTARQASHAHALGELGGLVRVTLWRDDIPFVDVPPASLKVYATGHGNAPKAEVLAAAIRRLGYQGHNDNEADAMWLRAMALHHYGHPVVDLPQTHLRGLDKVDWPALTAPAVV